MKEHSIDLKHSFKSIISTEVLKIPKWWEIHKVSPGCQLITEVVLGNYHKIKILKIHFTNVSECNKIY